MKRSIARSPKLRGGILFVIIFYISTALFEMTESGVFDYYSYLTQPGINSPGLVSVLNLIQSGSQNLLEIGLTFNDVKTLMLGFLEFCEINQVPENLENFSIFFEKVFGIIPTKNKIISLFLNENIIKIIEDRICWNDRVLEFRNPTTEYY